MTSELRAQRDLIDQILDISEERESAYEQRDANPERWRAAKQAYAEARRHWRDVAAWKKAVDESAASVSAPIVKVSSEVLNPTAGHKPVADKD